MRRFFWRVSITGTVAFALVAASCGGGGDKTKTEPTTASTTTLATTTTMAETTTRGTPAPLTGLPLSDPAIATRPALIIKIDNSDNGTCDDSARPQVGINQADMVIEEFVEGITRFFTVFQSNVPPVVGPVRSARSSDVDLLTAFNKPMFGWSGNNGNVAVDLQSIKNQFVNVGYDSSWSNRYYRENNGRCAPHNLFARATELLEAAPAGAPPSSPFSFRDVGQSLPADMGVPTQGVKLTMGSPVTFDWNSSTKQWDRSQKGTPHVDADGKVIAVENVVVLMTTYKMSSTAGSLQAVTTGKGRALIYTDGKVVDGEWSRETPTSQWTLTAGDKTIPLTPGRSWVYLAFKGSVADLTNQISG